MRGFFVVGIVASFAVGCGGIDGARFVDEQTVVFPRGAIDLGRTFELRAQIAGEFDCPVGAVELADPVAVGTIQVVPVRACGARVFYAAVDGSHFQLVHDDLLRRRAAEAAPLAPATVAPETPQPGDDP